MITDDEIGYKRQFVGITTLFLILLALLVIGSANESKERYLVEKQRVEQMLEDAAQVIKALEYNITALYPLQNDRYVLPHTITLNEHTCNFGGKSQSGKDYDFVLSGPVAMCDTNSALFSEAYERLFVAPSMAYFTKVNKHIAATYFISKSKFMISSPKEFAQSVRGDDFDRILTSRAYWIKTLRLNATPEAEEVVFTGEYQDSITKKRVVTLTRGIYVDGEFKGVLAIDSNLEILAKESSTHYKLTEKQSVNRTTILSFTYSQPVLVSGQDTGLFFTVHESKREHLVHIFEFEKQRLIALISFYVLALCILWFRYTQTTHTRLKELAMRDPMTNLLNRRGFAARLAELQVASYLAIAVFDIDDFKAINDECGHQVGDDILCQIAKSLSTSLRQTDLIARFGGEEFVIAITSESAELARVILERVQSEISGQEVQLGDGILPVTASGGAVIYQCDQFGSIAQLWLNQGIVAADALLYKAKKAGKNRIYIEIDR